MISYSVAFYPLAVGPVLVISCTVCLQQSILSYLPSFIMETDGKEWPYAALISRSTLVLLPLLICLPYPTQCSVWYFLQCVPTVEVVLSLPTRTVNVLVSFKELIAKLESIVIAWFWTVFKVFIRQWSPAWNNVRALKYLRTVLIHWSFHNGRRLFFEMMIKLRDRYKSPMLPSYLRNGSHQKALTG